MPIFDKVLWTGPGKAAAIALIVSNDFDFASCASGLGPLSPSASPDTFQACTHKHGICERHCNNSTTGLSKAGCRLLGCRYWAAVSGENAIHSNSRPSPTR